MKKRLFLTLIAVISVASAKAFTAGNVARDILAEVTLHGKSIDSLSQNSHTDLNDTPDGRHRLVSPETRDFLPRRGRIDRGLNNIKFVYKGEMAIGLTVSYTTLSSDDTDYMLILDAINLKGNIFTINPSFSYFISDNFSLGARIGYTKINGTLGNLSLNLGSGNDVSMSFSDVMFNSNMTSVAAFMRSYAGIDRKGSFGLFGELEMALAAGATKFGMGVDNQDRYTDSRNLQFKLGFNSGLAVYIFPNVCCSLSFGLGGIQYNKITQRDLEGNETGSRTKSGFNLRLNITDIKIGVNIHL